ncbi:MAG: hypothetical protein H3C51_11555 [Rubellimicrobium sp.]|nr:hypothetical protein [Rubellimicrobium sp.]
MADDLPQLYFRTRENGALVFRLDSANRERRLDLVPLASVNLNNGQIRPQGEREPTEAEREEIARWMEDRRAALATRTLDDIRRAVDHLNLVAGWAQARATDAELDAVTDPLLLAMHDLRTVLVRRRAERGD